MNFIYKFSNYTQRVRVWFRCVRTKIANKEKPIVQQQGFSAFEHRSLWRRCGKSDAMNYIRC